MSSKPKPHLSASQMESYSRCPEAYRRRYLDGDVIPPGIAILKGTALHAGAEHNFRQKLETHEDLPASDIVDASIASLESAKAGAIAYSDEEVSRGIKTVFGEAVDAVAELASVHAHEQAPDYQPTMVEQAVRIDLPNSPRDLLAVIDLADDQNRVVDFKTAGKSKNQADADDSVQLTVYAAAFSLVQGEPPAELRLDTLVQLKTQTKRQIVSTTRGDADFNALANRINAINKSIDAGSFPPATPGAWWCGPKWCGYFRTCPYVNSERAEKAQKGDQ
jgi:RecB family exonuclease